jgi:hypothetical protein
MESKVQWYTPVIPATGDMEMGGSRSRLTVQKDLGHGRSLGPASEVACQEGQKKQKALGAACAKTQTEVGGLLASPSKWWPQVWCQLCVAELVGNKHGFDLRTTDLHWRMHLGAPCFSDVMVTAKSKSLGRKPSCALESQLCLALPDSVSPLVRVSPKETFAQSGRDSRLALTAAGSPCPFGAQVAVTQTHTRPFHWFQQSGSC